ncbi:MAG: FAD binding domain-containing protein [Vicinamibacterales bacterium]
MAAFLLNGVETHFGEGERDLTLLDFVRRAGFTGAKEGCGEGECGACAVAIVRPHDTGSTYRVVNSCLIPLALIEGHEVLTIEGIAASGQDAALRALAESGGSQCGFCTPGFAVSLTAEHCRPGRTGACSTDALAGNLCRCTGYRPIADAAASLIEPASGALSDRLTRPAPAIKPSSGAGFVRPGTLAGVIDVLASAPDAVPIAGGTDLGIEQNKRDRRFGLLVGLEAVDELRVFDASGTRVLIGAALPLTEIDERWVDAPPVWRRWLALFASPLIRNRATLGGNLATASPIGDSAPLLMALDAVVHVAGPSGSRTIPVAHLFAGYRKTVLERGELITAVEVRTQKSEGRPGGPGGPGTRVEFYKVARRRLNDISTVTAAIAVERDAGARVVSARVCLGGVAATPLRVEAAEQAVVGAVWDEAATARVQAVLADTLRPMTDHRGTREFRLAVAQSLVARFAWEHLR